MGNWFGDLDLAYKYTIVFGSLLLLTLIAGFLKVWYNHRRMAKLTKELKVEEGPREDQVELNQREKDEGDLFGIRAIEAGFYAGIPQSRPTSRAGSIAGSPSMSSSTLIGGGGLNTPKIQSNSMNNSVTSLPLARTTERYRDSETLPSDSPPQKKATPAIRLQPSDAQMTGNINHSSAVNMSLNVPPSPVTSRHSPSPTFDGSDDGDNDAQAANYKPDHYVPAPPQIPMPNGLRASVRSAEDTAKSQTASLAGPSPGSSNPSSPGYPPEARLPSLPSNQSERPTSIRLQPVAYQPVHQRDTSNASSIYSDKRTSTYNGQHERSDSAESYNYSFPEHSSRNSIGHVLKETDRNPNQSGGLLAPSKGDKNDPRFSEFYDSYYRQSLYGGSAQTDASKRPNQPNETIDEVPSPLPSPLQPAKLSGPGMAM